LAQCLPSDTARHVDAQVHVAVDAVLAPSDAAEQADVVDAVISSD
jgi:hypothetical protein